MPGIQDVVSHLSVPRYAPRTQPLAIPEAAWNDEPLFCLKVNDEWLSHVLGVLIALDQQDTWIGTDEEIWLARQQVNEIMASLMEGCGMDCCLPPLSRINDDGTMSVSYDGGTTWQDATTEDPRTASPALPPVDDGEGADVRCKATNRVIRQFKDAQIEFKNNLGGGLTVLQLALAFAGAVAVLFLTGGTLAAVLVPALLSLAAAVVGTGATAYDDLFTSDVWATLLCKVYCHTETDGSYNQTDFLDILSDIDGAGFDSTVALTLTSIMRGWQLPGLLNASRIPTVDNLSCDDCICSDHIRVFIECEGAAGGTEISWDGSILEASSHNNGGTEYIYFIFQDETCGGDHSGFTCGSLTVEENTSLADFAAYVPCGSSSQTSPGLTPPNELCGSQFVFTHSSPFTMRVSAVTCP